MPILRAPHPIAPGNTTRTSRPSTSRPSQATATAPSMATARTPAVTSVRTHPEKSDDTMNAQTYYATNQTPQLQDSFNSGIWSSLEKAVRSLTSGSDTLYVATGPCYQTVGGKETVRYLTAVSSTTPQQVPVPNYYWKAILKIKTTNGYITDACAIGIWLEHKAYKDSDYTQHIVSIDDIESKTGFDLFAGLPEYLESAVKAAKTSWSEFSNF